MLLGQPARRASMCGVVTDDVLDTGARLDKGAKRDDSPAARLQRCTARVLSQDRLAAGQIADAPVADPATVRRHIHMLGDHEFGRRSLDEGLILPWITGNTNRV